jgi:hypothetical protein
MPVGSLKYNPTTSTHGKFVQSAVTSLKDGKRRLADLMGILSQMINGDGSQDVHYAYMTTALGCPDDATAHLLFNELNTNALKLSTDASVTTLNASLEQLFSKLTV